MTDPEPAVLSTSAPTVGEHLQDRVLVDIVLTFAQSFGAVFVSGSQTIVRLATQPHKPVTRPLHLEQTRCPLIARPARLTARLVADPRFIGESTAYVLDGRRNIRAAAIRSGVGSNVLVVPGSRGRRRTRQPRPNRRSLYPSRGTEKEGAPGTC